MTVDVFLKSEGQYYFEHMQVCSIFCLSNGVKRSKSPSGLSKKKKKEVTRRLAQVMLWLQVGCRAAGMKYAMDI